MLINKRCTVCHGDIDEADTELCGECGDLVHARCATFERQYTCRDCAAEPEVGVQEF